MASSAVRLSCLWFLVLCAFCVASATEDAVQSGDSSEDVAKMTRKLLHDGLGCACAHQWPPGDCPCHPDTTWLKNGECPSCPVYACGDCDPLKCNECKRCCDGTVLSDDRKTCSCPSCDITGCLECDAADCSKCLVCQHGFKLGVDRKCECATCHVPYCETCEADNCYKCKTCFPFLALGSGGKACECPECPINGCKVCNPEKCDECNECVEGELPDCKPGPPVCKIPHCAVCAYDGTCKECKYGYELTNYNQECKCAECTAPNCLECDPMNCDNCWVCNPGYTLKPSYVLEEPSTCVCHNCTAAHCAVCDVNDCSKCYECDVRYKKDKNGVCTTEVCEVPGCVKCDPDSPNICVKCPDTHTLTDDGQCVCASCDAPNCDTCSEYDCTSCEVCSPGYKLDEYSGVCVCKECDIPHCTKCSPKDCSICEACEKYYGPSGYDHCPAESCQVERCIECDPTDCHVCKKCEDPHVPSDDGSECVWPPDDCTIPHCVKCSDYDNTVCVECESDLYPDPSQYGRVCECQHCEYIQGCEKCDPEDCSNCLVCKEGLVLSDDKKSCECASCDVKGCKECSPLACHVCTTCANGAEPVDGQCPCAPCHIDNCAAYSKDVCGTCAVCKTGFYFGDDDHKTCECSEKGLVGCIYPAGVENQCLCSECIPELTRSNCGYCIVDCSIPGCGWDFLQAVDGKSCDQVCAQSSVFTQAVSADKGHKHFSCFNDLGEKDGLRAGTYEGGLCTVEYDYKSGSVAPVAMEDFSCVCKRDGFEVDWYDSYSEGQPCSDVCAAHGLNPVALPGWGDRKPGSPTAHLPISVCRVGDWSGFNVEVGSYKGKCATPKCEAAQYQCLCGKGQCDNPVLHCDQGLPRTDYVEADPFESVILVT